MKFARIALVSLAALAAAQDKKADGQNPISSPTTGTKISPGENFYITWVADPSIQAITLSLIKDGQKVLDIAPGQANDGKFTWPVPFDLKPGSDYSVEITTFNGENVNYSPNFTITDRDESLQNQIQNPNAHALTASTSGGTAAAASDYTWSDVNTQSEGVFASGTSGSGSASATGGSSAAATTSGSESKSDDKSDSASKTESKSESKSAESSESKSDDASSTGDASSAAATSGASGSGSNGSSAAASSTGGKASGSNGSSSGSASATGSSGSSASSAGSSASASASSTQTQNNSGAGSLQASVGLILAAGVAAQLL